MIDVLIPTIGRESLRTALLAGLSQSYPYTRVVVVGDGRQPEAEAIFSEMAGDASPTKAIYRECPRFGHGNFVKEWWINNPEAAPWIRVVDDDDWIPTYAIAEMARPITPEVTLVICKMVVCVSGNVGESMRYRISAGDLTPEGASSGTCMLRTSAVRGPYPTRLPADHQIALRASASGRVRFVDTPLYWYNGYRGGKTVARPLGQSYGDKWLYRHPHSFRKSLLRRVPLANFRDANGELFRRAEDQAMFRPMARLAKRTSRIAAHHYYYDVRCYDWTPPQKETADARAFIVSRGVVTDGPCIEGVAPDYTLPEICFLVPCYRATAYIGRCIKSIQNQRGDWRCIIAVDGNDRQTAKAARNAIGGDGRFEVVLQPTRLYGLGNQLSVIKTLPDNTIVAQVDGDDFLLGDEYALTLAAAYSNPDVEMTYGRGAPPAKTPEGLRVREELHELSVERSALLAERDIAPDARRVVEIDRLLGELRPKISVAKRFLAGGKS